MGTGQEFGEQIAAEGDSPLVVALRAQAGFWPIAQADLGEADGLFTPAIDLFRDDAFLERMFARNQAATSGLDRRGAAAFLLTEYGAIFATTAVAAFVGFDLVPDLSPGNYALSLRAPSGSGEPPRRPDVFVRLLSDGFTTSDRRHASHPFALQLVDREGLCETLRHEIEGHFKPLIERLHELTRLSRTGAWRLVADSVAAWFLAAGERFDRLEYAQSAAFAVLKKQGSPLNNRQVHFFDIAIRSDAGGEIIANKIFRQRGGCCRLYTADEGTMCTTCVLRKPDERDAIIAASMCRRLGLHLDVTKFTSKSMMGQEP